MSLFPVSSSDVYLTRGLSSFLTVLRGRESPVLVDLGSAVGRNVTLLSELLGCKLHVVDILSKKGSSWLETGASESEGKIDSETLSSERDLSYSSGSIDGVLCWDVMDYLGNDSAVRLADELSRILKPGGVIFLCHGSRRRQVIRPVSYEIVDENSLRYKEIKVSRPDRVVRESGPMVKMFGTLTVAGSFLLSTSMRELVLRKPGILEVDS